MKAIPTSLLKTLIFWHMFALILVVSFAMSSWIRHRHQYDSLIIDAGLEHGLPPQLISAVIWKESRFKADAVGGVGEIGLMQITELVGYEWAGEKGIEDFEKNHLFNPKTNLNVGAWYLAKGMKKWDMYDDPLPFALAEYNAGHANVKRWSRKASDAHGFIERITYPNTQRYVRDILERYRGEI